MKYNDQESSTTASEYQPLNAGTGENTRPKRVRRRALHFLVAAVALVFIGQGFFGIFCRPPPVECVPYEGGTTSVDFPVHLERSSVLLHPSVASGKVLVEYVDKDSDKVAITLKEDPTATNRDHDIVLCKLKGDKLMGLGIFAQNHGRIPVIKSTKVEIPKSIPRPNIELPSADVLPPPGRSCSMTRLFC